MDMMELLTGGMSEEQKKQLKMKEQIEAMSPTAQAELLREAAQRLVRDPSLKVGDVVMMKPGLENKVFPHAHRPGIIMRFLDEPVLDPSEESGYPTYREPMDTVIGIVANGQSPCLVEFHVDGRRLTHWVEPEDAHEPAALSSVSIGA